ncbi:MAG TPA: response regulator transcription factor [Firmicutes bacterium]|jgi:FixJ family two-component response regulator|nr:response regulator transcription factor [Bacillota bacterium]
MGGIEDMPPTVFIVDDDPSVRKSLERLLRASGFTTQAFASAEDFLACRPCQNPKEPACLVLDVRMPGISGINLQQKLAKTGIILPVVFITGHGDIPMSVQAMKDGAIDFLPKPFAEKELLAAVEQALTKAARLQEETAEKAEIHRRVNTLTPREYEVFRWVITGMLNKEIAAELRVTEKTIKVHRARVMQKMAAASLADLVRLAEKIGIASEKRSSSGN